MASEGKAWIKRARAHLELQNDQSELTSDAIASVGDLFASIVMDSIVTESSGLGARARMEMVEKALVALVEENPRARSHRMIKYWELLVDAFNGERRDEGEYWTNLCTREADALVADPTTGEEALRIAKDLRAQIKKQLGR